MKVESFIRKHGFVWAIVATIVLVLCVASAQAEESAVAKAAAWKIGDQLEPCRTALLARRRGGERQGATRQREAAHRCDEDRGQALPATR